jgi:outer membrane lipoprotein-sorting protein
MIIVGFGMAQNAETVLNEASGAYEKSNGISAQFTINIQSDKQGLSESFEGTIQMKGNKFVLITPDTRTWYNGTTQWTYMLSTDEVYVTEPSDDELQLINPIMLLRTYNNDFNLSYINENTSDNGKPAHNVLLASKASQSDIEKIEIQIEKATSLPVKMNVYMKNNIRNLIRIGKMQIGINQADSFFMFNPKDYPGAIEIDLR